MIQSEVKLNYKELFCGMADIICGLDKIKNDYIIFDEDKHIYKINNKIIPSVTQLLDDGSYDRLKGSEMLEYACNKGIRVHKEVEDFLKENIKSNSHEFVEFLKIYIKNKDIFNSQCIMDIKTYKYLTPQNRDKADKQMTLYCKAIKQMTGVEIKDKYVIHLPENNKGELVKL